LNREPNEPSNPAEEPVVFRPARVEADFPRVVLRPGGVPRLALLRVDDTLRLVLLYLRVVSFPPCLRCRVLLESVICEAL
jgi:hypothetical protein